MTSKQKRSDEHADRPRPTRAQRIVAAGFLGAFGLTIITVLLTGLWVRSPTRRGAEAPPAATLRDERGLIAPPAEARPQGPALQHEAADAGATESTDGRGAVEPHEHTNEAR